MRDKYTKKKKKREKIEATFKRSGRLIPISGEIHQRLDVDLKTDVREWIKC